jgi:hypothetical protein
MGWGDGLEDGAGIDSRLFHARGYFIFGLKTITVRV